MSYIIRMSRLKRTTVDELKQALDQVPGGHWVAIIDNYSMGFISPIPDMTVEELLDAPRGGHPLPVIIDLEKNDHTIGS